MEVLSYELSSDMLCLGERIKKGTLRPTLIIIPYSQITGALKSIFNYENIHAVGHITNNPKKESITYSPTDKTKGISKIPLTIEYLTNVRGMVYILKNEETRNLPENIVLNMGAMKSKGFGKTILIKKEDVVVEKSLGLLNTRIPLNVIEKFDIEIKKPIYGYLFKPTSKFSGEYVLSLFEGSEIVGPKFLLGDKSG